MNVSLNWLKEYIDLKDHDPQFISEVLTSIGLEVEGMEEKEAVPGGLKGIVVGEVLTCEKHPNADKLSLTTVNIGLEEPVQIVCGAPNVAAGQKVLVATVGSTLYPSVGDSFKIKKGKIRGEDSFGMICAEDELGLGVAHDGIMVLADEANPGTPAKKHFNLTTDVIYEIGLTPNRADANSHLGVAKDLAAALQITKGDSGKVNIPDVSSISESDKLPIQVTIESDSACPRYCGIVLDDVVVKESPDWMKQRLLSIGLRPINNIVDITNFVLHETGQPLHAFDYDKIAGAHIRVKFLPESTPFLSLDEVERKLLAEDLMICDGDSTPMCMAGVFGGLSSGVTESTTRIFLESAFFDAKTIRRTSMKHVLRTDAATHFEKGVDPNGTLLALKRAAALICEYAEATTASKIVDHYPKTISADPIKVRFRRINQIIGDNIEPSKIKEILSALHIKITAESEDGLTITVPTDKPDVIREIDVIEEILRIYGFNAVQTSHQIKSVLSLSPTPDPDQLKQAVGQMLVGGGFYEMMGLSLTQSKYTESIFPIAKEELVFIQNTSNIHLDIMRPSMVFSGLETVLHNQNRQQGDLRFFEFGKSYRNGEEAGAFVETSRSWRKQYNSRRSEEAGAFVETSHLVLYITGQRSAESWIEKSVPTSFFDLKSSVETILDRMGVKGFQQAELEADREFDYGMKYFRGPTPLVRFGQLRAKMCSDFDIKSAVFYAEFNWEALIKANRRQKIELKPINKYPTVRRDLALVIEKSVNFQEIQAIAMKAGKKLIKSVNLFDRYENVEQVGEGKKSYAISLLLSNDQKTLTEKEIDQLMKTLIKLYQEKLGAIIRS